jgi:hypothetical protein
MVDRKAGHSAAMTAGHWVVKMAGHSADSMAVSKVDRWVLQKVVHLVGLMAGLMVVCLVDSKAVEMVD